MSKTVSRALRLLALAALSLAVAGCSGKATTSKPAGASSKPGVSPSTATAATSPTATPAGVNAPLTAPSDIDDIGWLVGRWVANTKEDGCFFEHWLKPAGGTMLGTGAYVPVGGKTYQEGMRFLASKEGLTYIVTPDDRVVKFKAQPSKPGTVRLTADNQFPAIITYTRKGPDSYHVRLAAQDNVESLEFTYVRVGADVDCSSFPSKATP